MSSFYESDAHSDEVDTDSFAISEETVQAINDSDLKHRKGWRPSQVGVDKLIEHFEGEVRELVEAVQEGELEHIKEEMGDVFACLLQIGFKYKISFYDIDVTADQKMRLRFDFSELESQIFNHRESDSKHQK